MNIFAPIANPPLPRSTRPAFRSRGRRGLTLMEVMMAMFVFTILALGVTATVLQVRRISQLNIMRQAAFTVAQGYLEQIMSINPANLEAASEPWVSNRPAIPTESVNSLISNSTVIEVSDPLYVSPLSASPSGANMTARTDTGYTGDMWNNKTIMVDLVTGSNGTLTPIVMNEQLDVTVSRAWTVSPLNGAWQIPQGPSQPTYFLVRIDFQFRSNGYLSAGWMKGTLRMCRTDIPGG